MKYEDARMEAYWNTLPAEVRAIIEDNGVELCSLGMLTKIGDYYRNAMAGQPDSGEGAH